jgi:hypothetical protein
MKYILIASLIIGCSSTPAVQPKEQAPTAPQEIRECIGSDGEILACESLYDCCRGFSCTFDPEKSQRQRYCIYTGE